MKNWFGTAAVGTVLAITGAVSVPASAQTSAMNAPGHQLMTPETTGRGNNDKMSREFDVKRLTDPIYGAHIHGEADKIAKCLMRRSGSEAPNFLGGQLVGDPDYGRLGSALSGRHKRCAEVEEGAPALAISGVLAEELLAAQPSHFDDRAAGVSQDAARKFFGDLSGVVTIDSVTGCLAVYSPGLAYKVVQSESGSKEEAAALAALYKQTPECGMSSAPSEIPVIYQRGYLATALYAWTHQKA